MSQRGGTGTGRATTSTTVVEEDPSRDIHRRGSAWSITHMPDEIAEYAIDAPIFTDVKAADIRLHHDDAMKDIYQRAILILKGTQQSQKIFAAVQLPEMIQQDENRTFTEIVPLIEQECKVNEDVDFHYALANSIKNIVPAIFAKSFKRAKHLVGLAASLTGSEKFDVSDAWCDCFDSLIEAMSPELVLREIVPYIVERFAKENASVNAKRSATKLLGKLAMKLNYDVVIHRLFPAVDRLARDPDPRVRAGMCLRLPEIVYKAKAEDRIFPLLTALVNDTDPKVMSSLVGALGKAVTIIYGDKSIDTKVANKFSEATVPIFKKFVKKAYVDSNFELLKEFSEILGPIASIFSANGVLSVNSKLWFLDAYLNLSRYGLPSVIGERSMPPGFIHFRRMLETTGNPRRSVMEGLISSAVSAAAEAFKATTFLGRSKVNNKAKPNNNADTIQHEEWIIRANCAEGFTSFLKFAKPLVGLRQGLHPLMVELIHDPVPEVRAKMASAIWPVFKAVGVDEAAELHAEVTHALSDGHIKVFEGIMAHLGDIMKVFVQAKLISPDQMTPVTVEIGGALLFCEERLSQSNDWRSHATLLSQLAVLPFCLPSDYVYNNFVPALFHRLNHMRQLPCRMAAADVIIAYLRYCRRAEQREDIRNRIKEGFATGTSVHDRMLFMFMSKKITEVFSRKYFRDHFFETTLAMAEDNVANVRMKAVNMLPDLKETLILAEDTTLLEKLEQVFEKVKNSETDRDVQNAIRSAIPEMSKIGVVLKGDKNYKKTAKDYEDEKKEARENYIASLESHMGKKMAYKHLSISALEPPLPPPAPPKKAPPPPPPPKSVLNAPGPSGTPRPPSLISLHIDIVKHKMNKKRKSSSSKEKDQRKSK